MAAFLSFALGKLSTESGGAAALPGIPRFMHKTQMGTGWAEACRWEISVASSKLLEEREQGNKEGIRPLFYLEAHNIFQKVANFLLF